MHFFSEKDWIPRLLQDFASANAMPYVSYLYEVNGNRFRAQAGDVVCVPEGAAHAFLNVSDQPSRQLVMMLLAMHSASSWSLPQPWLGPIMTIVR